MKNIALTLCLTFLMAACSSGTSVSEVPPIITGLYTGPFESSNSTNSGTFIMNLAEDESNMIQGTLQIDFPPDPTCFSNTLISGSINGFNVRLEAQVEGERRTTTTTTTNDDGTTTSTEGTETQTGTITFQLTANNNSLTGTFVTTGNVCSNFSGSGTTTITR